MAIALKGYLPAFLRGSIQRLVFRKRYGQLEVYFNPPPEKKKKFTPAQKAHHQRFTRASAWGAHVLANQELKKVYQQKVKHTGVYQLAIQDAMCLPEIRKINPAAFLQKSGGAIHITAWDDVKVTGVWVKLYHPESSLEESGAALPHGSFWRYFPLRASWPEGTMIEVRVKDLPGNEVVGVRFL